MTDEELDKKIVEAKALAYDLIRMKEKVELQLRNQNQLILQLEQKKNAHTL